MNVYKQKNRPNYYFALMFSHGDDRKQAVVNTFVTDKRAATEVLRKTQLLAETIEAGMSLTPELRSWLGQMNPKLRKRLSDLGLVGDLDHAGVRSIQTHIDDYLESCRFRGDDSAFIKIKRSQLERAVRGMRVDRLHDVSLERATPFFHELRKTRSARTVNQNRATLLAFLNWCAAQGRLQSHRLRLIPRLNEDVDRRRVRRAATEDELDRFLAAVPSGRRLPYLMALLTGLRRKELRHLEARDVDLATGTLTVRAEIAKKKITKVLPIHAELRGPLAERIQSFGSTARILTSIPTMKTYRRDLSRAGVVYRDDQGRQLDFHALRATFTTRLLRQGVPPAIARRLTRHGSVKTLEKYYDKLGFDDAAKAMQQMPGVDPNRHGDGRD